MSLLSYLVLGFLAVGARGDSLVINQAIDQLLTSVKLILVATGESKIPLKDLNKSFSTKIFGVPVPGSFVASGGLVQDLSTLQRTGDVVLTTDKNTMKLKFAIGFGTLNLQYSHYDFKFTTITSSGSINVITSGSSVGAELGIVKQGKQCLAQVDQAALETLGQTQIQFTGPQVLNQFLSMILNWVLDNFNTTIKDVVNSKLKDALSAGLLKTDICSHLPF